MAAKFIFIKQLFYKAFPRQLAAARAQIVSFPPIQYPTWATFSMNAHTLVSSLDKYMAFVVGSHTQDHNHFIFEVNK